MMAGRPIFGTQRPDHAPPETLTDADLRNAISSLERKLRSAQRALIVATIAGWTLTAGILALGFFLLWIGPTPFLQRMLGRGGVATPDDGVGGWGAGILRTVLGGAFADQLVRGRLRLARGWRARVHELSSRLGDARSVAARRG